MKVRFHPVVDNPIRMGYVPGWSSISDLIERVGDLEHAVGERSVVPARWEPYYKECPTFRYAGAYAWAQSQLRDPSGFAVALALFPGEQEQLDTRIGRAIWQILCTKTEPSQITRRLILAEAVEIWDACATDWLERIVRTCAALGVETSVALLGQHVHQALQPLTRDVPPENDASVRPSPALGFQASHGFDKELLAMDGWTPDPGRIILPVDGRIHSLARGILLLDLHKVVLLRARSSVRSVAWEQVSLVHLFEGAVIFEVNDQPPLVVPGYKHPEAILKTIQECYEAATERILQKLATQVLHRAP